eukprot:4776157-Amphidinium_carterae.6
MLELQTLKRQILGSGPCTSLEWPDFLGSHPLDVEEQLARMDALHQAIVKLTPRSAMMVGIRMSETCGKLPQKRSTS